MITIFTLTDAGKTLAYRLRDQLETVVSAASEDRSLECQILHKPIQFKQTVQHVFSQAEQKQDVLIFICATGIVMRTLAPVLENKYQDVPVLVMDEQGRFVIPLLSGHEGGANQLANQIAGLLNAQPVITTAGHYLNPVYTVGMGCERHCPKDELERLLQDCLQQAGLSIDQISSINSIDIKSDEVGLIELAQSLNKPFHTWHKDQLNTMDHLLNSRSEYVFNTVGVYGVAESAALYGAEQALIESDPDTAPEMATSEHQTSGNPSSSQQVSPGSQPELALVKQKTRKATCAIARIYPATDKALLSSSSSLLAASSSFSAASTQQSAAKTSNTSDSRNKNV